VALSYLLLDAAASTMSGWSARAWRRTPARTA